MINTGSDLIVCASGAELDQSIRRSMLHASNSIKEGYGLADHDLLQVTTKTNPELAYCKVAELVWLQTEKAYDEDFIRDIFAFYTCDGTPTMALTAKILPEYSIAGYAMKVFLQRYKSGFGLFLLRLHCEGTIVLPASFNWPGARHSPAYKIIGQLICQDSELLAFVRSLDPSSEGPFDPAFKSLATRKQREYFATYGTKLLLATGWSTPEQANLNDLIQIYRGQAEDREDTGVVSSYSKLIKIIVAKFGARIPDDFRRPRAWNELTTSAGIERDYKKKSAELFDLFEVSNQPSVRLANADEAFSRLLNVGPDVGDPAKLANALSALSPEHRLKQLMGHWTELECIYFDRVQRENYGVPKQALGHFNLYLCYYLPMWFEENPTTTLIFPSTPDQLIGTIFISRMVEPDVPAPRTFMELMNARAQKEGWVGNSYYAILNQVQIFFSFLISHAHHFSECSNFLQPFTQTDFPSTTSLMSTNKRPMPRRLFGAFLSYVEAIKLYVDGFTEKILSGELAIERVRKLKEITEKMRYCVQCEDFIDLVPAPELTINDKLYRLRFIPFVFKFEWKEIKDGRYLLLPHPHAINQIIVALYTGIRLNHIQWLDAETFDYYADIESAFTQLLVNTDKVSKNPWCPHVNSRVIEVLRDQLAWRNMIQEPMFLEKQFYNDNPKTSYPKFLPLFANDAKGLPHGDWVYSRVWRELIFGFQEFMPEFYDGATNQIPVLCKLRPPGVGFADAYEDEKLKIYEDVDSGTDDFRIVTNITPHSTRVGVVSDLIHHLPAEIIGKRITGQKEAVVYHYVKLDDEDIDNQELYQAMDLRSRARKIDRHLSGISADDEHRLIKADAVNSNLAKSMKIDMQQTIARYGCISIVTAEGYSGINTLQEYGMGQAAFNKTEICPFGNNCPPELVKLLKGMRRCAVCPYAVRSVDHLPAVCAKKKCDVEELMSLDNKIRAGIDARTYTSEELADLEADRVRLGENVAGWELCEEVLEQVRQRLANDNTSSRWVVEDPEILIKGLQRVGSNSEESTYLLSRLLECNAYPGMQSQMISKKLDLLRRRVLINAGRSLNEVLSLDIPVDPAAECAGVIRSLVGAHKLTIDDVVKLVTSDEHLQMLPKREVLRIANA